MNEFAFDLWNQLQVGANMLISPASVYSVLLRSALGAMGTTRHELLFALGLPEEMDNENLLYLGRQLEASMSNNAISVANGLFVEESLRLKAAFMATLSESELQRVAFASDPDNARRQINDWVAQYTQQRILDLLGEGTINSMTALVLVNALYLKASWLFAFDPAETLTDHFYPSGRNYVEVDMMTQERSFPYIETETFQAVQLPYAGTQMYRLYVLPKVGVSLESVEHEIAEMRLTQLLSLMRTTEVIVFVPKFEMGWGTENLLPALQSMGINQACIPGADFSAILDGPLYISGIHQKTWMKDHEEGSEMAAATAAVFTLECFVVNTTPTFYANRPLMFFNMVPTQAGDIPVFMGRLADPSLL